jgi:superoxide dismutase, Cu-Zn family
MRTTITMLAGLLALQACKGGDNAAGDSAATGTPAVRSADSSRADSTRRDSTRATAPMRDASGRDIGTLTLSEGANGITVSGRLTGLTPGDHGIHIHMTGQCTPPFTSAGGHWNPTTKQHGSQNPQGPHLGDMPNLTVGSDSSANVQLTTAGGTLRGTNGLLDTDGAAVVVHAKADDMKTDPSGNSGDRIACGVVAGS